MRVDPRSDPRDPRYDPRYDPRRQQQLQREYDERYQQQQLQQQQQQQRQQQETQDYRRTDPRFVNDTVDTYRDKQPRYAAQGSGQNYMIIVDHKPEERREVQPPVNSDNSVRFARIRPPTVVKDQYGNLYERRQENGHVIYYADPHVQKKQLNVPAENRERESSSIVDARYQDAQWLRQRENMKRHHEERRRQEEQAREQLQRERDEKRRQEEEIRVGWLYVPDQQVQVGKEVVHITQEEARMPGAHHIGSGVLPEGTKFVGNQEIQITREEEKEPVEETERSETRVEEAEEKPVPFEKEDEVPSQPEKLPPPRPVVREDEDNEDDEN